MKLFNKYEAHNAAGQKFAEHLSEKIAPILQGAVNACESTVEVEFIALQVVATICAEIRIRRALAMRAKESG